MQLQPINSVSARNSASAELEILTLAIQEKRSRARTSIAAKNVQAFRFTSNGITPGTPSPGHRVLRIQKVCHQSIHPEKFIHIYVDDFTSYLSRVHEPHKHIQHAVTTSASPLSKVTNIK